MNHLPRDAQVLAEQLAEARGISPEEAVTVALTETLERTGTSRSSAQQLSEEDLIRRVDEISARYRARPLLDSRSANEILGYDEFGLPS